MHLIDNTSLLHLIIITLTGCLVDIDVCKGGHSASIWHIFSQQVYLSWEAKKTQKVWAHHQDKWRNVSKKGPRMDYSRQMKKTLLWDDVFVAMGSKNV